MATYEVPVEVFLEIKQIKRKKMFLDLNPQRTEILSFTEYCLLNQGQKTMNKRRLKEIFLQTANVLSEKLFIQFIVGRMKKTAIA